jgi:hypothetical protein
LFNSFSIHSEAWVTAVFHQVIFSNSFNWYCGGDPGYSEVRLRLVCNYMYFWTQRSTTDCE